MHLYNDNYSVLNGVGASPLEVQDAMLVGYGRLASTMSLQTNASFKILTWPNWNDEQGGWEAPIRAYLSAFHSEDDVCLLLRFDPHTVLLPTDFIYQRIEDMLPEYGLNDETMPELLLINDLLDSELQASLFNSVDAFLQSAGDIADPIHTARANETGIIAVPSGDSRALRLAYEQRNNPNPSPTASVSSVTQLAQNIGSLLPGAPPSNGTWNQSGNGTPNQQSTFGGPTWRPNA